MATWQDFTKGVINFAAPRVLFHIQPYTEGESVSSGDEVPGLLPDPLFVKIFNGFLEISQTVEIMKDTEVYIRQFPFSRSGIPRSRYLLFLIQSYFNEVYILRERLVNYAVTLERVYRKDPRGVNISEAAERAKGLTRTALSKITRIRGSHVHERRFTDERLDHFSATELIVTHSEPNELSPKDRMYMEWKYKELRRNWTKVVKEINEAVVHLLDRYANLLYGVVFNVDGEFIDPHAAHNV
jgi:hypothetical protein